MIISQLYKQYKLMPNLQTHMYRVAGVAVEICDHLVPETKPTVHKESIILTCLLHDVGNIIKFDLQKFPEFLQPEGIEYWQQVQNEFFAQYGFDEHIATLQIAKELGVSAEVLALIKAIDFGKAQANYESPNLNQKICAYADVRVTPFGVVSLAERLADLEERYAHKYPSEEEKQRRLGYAETMRKIEQQIFEQTTIQPDAITDAKVEQHFTLLQNISL